MHVEHEQSSSSYNRNITVYQGRAKKFPGFQVTRRYIPCSQDCATVFHDEPEEHRSLEEAQTC